MPLINRIYYIEIHILYEEETEEKEEVDSNVRKRNKITIIIIIFCPPSPLIYCKIYFIF